MSGKARLGVNHICSYFQDAFYRELMAAERRAGAEIKVFYFAEKGSAPLPEEQYLTQAFCYQKWDQRLYFPKQGRAFRAWKRAYPDLRADVLHAHSLFSNGYVAMRASGQTGLPYVVAVRSGDVTGFFERIPAIRPLGELILRRASAVVFLSAAVRDRVIEQYISRKRRAEIRAKSHVIPNGIADVFLDSAPERLLRTGDGKAINLLTVGVLTKNKNQIAVCRAAERLQAQGFQVRYQVIGAKAETQAAEEVLRCPFVSWLPPIPQAELIPHYRAADVFVLPSHKETFGLAYAEALSQGLPVVYTRGQGFDGQFPEGKVGLPVDADDVEGIAEAILSLYHDRARVFPEAVAGARAFRWDEIAKTYLSLYQEVRARP